jgi:hypothetical protein
MSAQMGVVAWETADQKACSAGLETRYGTCVRPPRELSPRSRQSTALLIHRRSNAAPRSNDVVIKRCHPR